MYRNNGSVLVLGLLVASILILFGGLFLSLTVDNYKYLYTDSEMVKAHWITRAGLNQMIHDVKDHYFSYDQFLETQKKYLAGVKFGDGTYQGGIGIVTGPGIREILLISEGIVGETSKDSIIVKLRITTPADFLKFIDGSYSFQGDWNRRKMFWGGPMHANGSIRFSLIQDTNLQPTCYLHLRKDSKLTGPVISCTGIVFHDGMYNYLPPMIVGEGDISGMFNENTDINKYTSETRNNDFTIQTFYIDQYESNQERGLLTKPVLTSYSNGSSPDITFDVTKNGVRQPLIMDGFHGGYNIAIPKKDEILSTFQPYIDPSYKITSNNVCFGRMVEFYNDDLQKKQELKQLTSRYVYSFTSAGTEKLGNVGTLTSTIFGGTDNASIYGFDTTYSGNRNIKYIDFYPATRYIELYENNTSGVPVDTSNYTINDRIGRLPHQAATAGRILFNTGGAYTPTQKLYTSKVKNVYVTNDTTNYTSRGCDIGITNASDRLGIQVSPINIDVNDVYGTITFKQSINEKPLVADVTGTVYQTANLINQSVPPIITSISKYDYSNQANVNSPTVPSTTQAIPPPTVRYIDSNMAYRLVDAYADKSDTWSCDMDMYGKIIDANGGTVVFMPRVLNGSNIRPWYNSSLTYTDFPIIAHKKIKIGIVDYFMPLGLTTVDGTTYTYDADNSDGVRLYILDTSGGNNSIPANLNDARLMLINTDGKVTKTSDNSEVYPSGTCPWIFSTPISTFGYNFGFTEYKFSFKFTGTLPTSINSDYRILMSYKYKYRPITNVNATLTSPQDFSYQSNYSVWGGSGIWGVSPLTGFKAILTDQYIKAVEIDLSNINSANYPKYGVIFSEVPLIVKGIPSKPITIVCLDDVYCGPINSPYYKEDGTLVSSSLTDDDPKAQPVGIISAGAVWSYFHLNRDVAIPAEPDNFDPSFHVKLNRVAIYSQGSEIYNYGGLQATNCCDLVGSFISATSQMGPEVISAKYLKYNYAGASGGIYVQGLYGGWGISPEKYASSFRRNLSPHFPADVRIKNWQPFTALDTEKFIGELSQYLNDTTYTNDPEKLEGVYKELTTKYFGGI